MKKQFLVYIFVLVTSALSAQLYEIGIFAGGSNYIGDIGSTNYINPNRIALGGVAKFNYTPRISFRGSLIYTQLRAQDSKSNSDFRVKRGLFFANNVLEASGGVEFNFFKYSMNQVGFSQTPYILVQASVANYAVAFEKEPDKYFEKRKYAIMPSLGLGYKFRIAENFSMSLESSIRYTLKDDIDETKVINIEAGNVNSDDWYVFTGFTITYGFGRPGCYKGFF